MLEFKQCTAFTISVGLVLRLKSELAATTCTGFSSEKDLVDESFVLWTRVMRCSWPVTLPCTVCSFFSPSPTRFETLQVICHRREIVFQLPKHVLSQNKSCDWDYLLQNRFSEVCSCTVAGIRTSSFCSTLARWQVYWIWVLGLEGMNTAQKSGSHSTAHIRAGHPGLKK